jgi:UDP-N-acetylglucosamine--N-acetylmuramyl-(pentapeptide) pyrophosphoryl-undecaprenol N-acetylglucosamine transferase
MSGLVVLAGGGTGGHIYPNVAIAQRLLAIEPGLRIAFVISDRVVDQRVREGIDLAGASWVVSQAAPLRRSVRGLAGFVLGSSSATVAARRRFRAERPLAVIATGGFVSGPEIRAARSLGVPAALVSLDATPGRAIRRLAPAVDRVFSAYETEALAGAEVIGFPLRREAVPDLEAPEARRRLGLEAERPTLVITAGSQGATSLNLGMARSLETTGLAALLRGWQVLHLTGGKDVAALERAYAASGLAVRLVDYLDGMGLAWRAATLAIARPGASSVAEAWANAVPSVFLPYPYHADEHQKHNARPMVEAGGAVLIRDLIDPSQNASVLYESICSVLGERDRLAAMRDALRARERVDGAERVAGWVLERASVRG